MTPRKPRAKAVRAAPASREAKRSPRRKDDHRAELPTVRSERDAFERDRAELCSALSHDLRNPLTVVVWSAQLLARRIPQDDAARRHVDGITRAAEEMNQMLHELSDAARIPVGRLGQAIELAEAEVGPLAEQAAAANRAQIHSKEIALTLDLPTDLGTISCDKERIARVLAALMSAAVRRSPKGGAVILRASRGVSGRRAEARIVVEDGGPDIPPEDREALFALPTAPAPGSARPPRPGGSAIALFVARGVIEAHGGRLWLEPKPDQGARFVLTLPAGAGR